MNRLGGTHSWCLMKEAEVLGLWTEKHLRSIWASHISGTANRQVDLLSRTTVDPGEWHLHPSIFNDIASWSRQSISSLPTPTARWTVSSLASRLLGGGEGVDALRSPWSPRCLYAFSLLAVIFKVIQKMLDEAVELILIAPHWPRHPWFGDLVALSMPPQRLPRDRLTLSQGSLLQPDIGWLKLTAWQLSGRSYGAATFLLGS